MFGGLGGALKSLTGKAEEMMEKTKKGVEELAAEKKAAAAAMLEGQAKKTSDSLLQSKSEIEKTGFDMAKDSKQAAIDGFDKEVAGVEKAIDGTLTEKKEEKLESAPLPIDPAKLAASAVGGLGDIDKEIEKALDGAIQQVGSTVDTKIKETDQFLDEKREQVVQQVQGEANKATESASQGVGAILGKAKGLLNF